MTTIKTTQMMNVNYSPSPHASTITFLIELRRRMIVYLSGLTVIFLGLLPFSRHIYQLISGPLSHQLPGKGSMIATQLTATFTAPVKLTFVIAVLLTIPLLLYQVWAFVAPALYQAERRYVWLLLVFTSVLFYLGIFFAYSMVLPFMAAFFIQQAPHGVEIKPDITQYLDFALRLCFAFGVTFEMPVFTVLLILTGTLRPQQLRKWRPYVIVAAFIIGMLLTPPDVVSQVLLAVPLWLLFELGLWIGTLAQRARRRMQGVA